MTRLSPRTACAVGVLGLGALLLSGCSSASGSATANGSVAPAASGAGDFAAYRNCLTQHGVSLPSFSARPSGAPRPSGFPSGRPSGRPSGGFGGGFFGGSGASADPSMAAAMQACASLRPQGGFGGGARGGTAMAAFTSCMKDHGVTLPADTRPGAINTADPKTAKAYAVCKALLPTRPTASASPTA